MPPPPASSLCLAVNTCVIPSAIYGSEVWYAGRNKPAAMCATAKSWSARDLATTLTGFRRPSQLPSGACFLSHAQPPPPPPSSGTRDSLPSAEAALEDARYRFALHPQTVDEKNALACWLLPPMIPRGVGTGTCQRVKTRLQLSATLIPEVPRPVLRRPHYTPGCGAYPKGGIDKDMAASAFVS
ncbi:hypothetical protein N7513_006861 [Penicillium frequentans]|nr:hypothetical protein N7513_006861 [Penicillium glabrum]